MNKETEPQPLPFLIAHQSQQILFPNFGPSPQRCVCPYCNALVLTDMKTKATSRTHMAACFLCMFLCLPCVCVPYCMDSCQNRNHYCPNCHEYLGKYDS